MSKTKQILDLLIQQAEEDWRLLTRPRYRVNQLNNFNPFSLKFLAAEKIKRQQFIVENINHFDFLWIPSKSAVAQIFLALAPIEDSCSWWYLLADPLQPERIDSLISIVDKSYQQVLKETLVLIKESCQIHSWKT